MAQEQPRFAMETPSAEHAEFIDTLIAQPLTEAVGEWFKKYEQDLVRPGWPAIPNWILSSYVLESTRRFVVAISLDHEKDDLLRRGLLNLTFASGVPKMVGIISHFACYEWQVAERCASTGRLEPQGPMHYADETAYHSPNLPISCTVSRRTDLVGIAVHLETHEGYFGKVLLGYRTKDRAFTPKPIRWEHVGATLPKLSVQDEGYLHYFAPAGADSQALPA